MTTTAVRRAVSEREIDRPLYVGAWFGFSPIDPPKITSADQELARSLTGEDDMDAALRASFLRTYLERGYASRPHPLILSYKYHPPGSHAEAYVFEVAGIASGAAEALLMRTALSVLEEEHHRGLSLELNTLGDRDSIVAYERDLAAVLKKQAESIEPDIRKRLRGRLFDAFELLRGTDIYDELPASVGSLSAPSRLHFKDVLEHVVSLGVPFRIAPELLGHREYASETLFRIKDEDGRPLARGFRSTRLTKRLGLKKELPVASVIVSGETHLAPKSYKGLPRPKFSLIELGPTARLQVLSTIEALRRERIAVAHGFGREKLSAQMALADELRVPYLLIIGQKEALEQSVTVRNVATRAQDTIPSAMLADYLKHIAL